METASVFKVGLKKEVLSTLEKACHRYECRSKRLAGLAKPFHSLHLKTSESILDVVEGYFAALALPGSWITRSPNPDLSSTTSRMLLLKPGLWAQRQPSFTELDMVLCESD